MWTRNDWPLTMFGIRITCVFTDLRPMECKASLGMDSRRRAIFCSTASNLVGGTALGICARKYTPRLPSHMLLCLSTPNPNATRISGSSSCYKFARSRVHTRCRGRLWVSTADGRSARLWLSLRSVGDGFEESVQECISALWTSCPRHIPQKISWQG